MEIGKPLRVIIVEPLELPAEVPENGLKPEPIVLLEREAAEPRNGTGTR